MNINKTIKLNNGVEIPIFGLGTWQSSPSEVGNAINWAVKASYRHIDTAAIYNNEEAVGKAIKESGVPREELFITTKLWNQDHNNVEESLNKSLKKLQLDYVDLYLIHFPMTGTRINAWKGLEKLYKEGKCKSIGVSNFMISHLKELLEKTDIVPAVNQVEFNAYLYLKELYEFCKGKGIVLEAYSPITHSKKLKDSKLIDISNKYNKTSAQMLIKWVLQKEIICIPKSVNEQRIKENADVFDFEISEEDMKEMDSFDEGFRTCWDPTSTP